MVFQELAVCWGVMKVYLGRRELMNRATRLQREALGVFPGAFAKYGSPDLCPGILGSQTPNVSMEAFLFCEDHDSAITGVITITLTTPDLQNWMIGPLRTLLSIYALYTISSPSNEYDSTSDYSGFLLIPFLPKRAACCMTSNCRSFRWLSRINSGIDQRDDDDNDFSQTSLTEALHLHSS